jgi:nitrate reductase molybdenum cofactor assembly chaperone NarJ/NarW
MSWKLLSVLLQYPDDPLLEALAEIELAAAQLPPMQRTPVEGFLAYLHATPAAVLRQEYVEAFDFDRRSAMHLTWHTHGDRRQRGIELIRLKRHYAEAGLPLADGELPDYLPVLLEFTELRPEQGTELLVGLRPSLELVRAALHRRQSPYADLLDAICVFLPKPTSHQLEQARKLALEGPPAELVGLEPFTAPDAAGVGL